MKVIFHEKFNRVYDRDPAASEGRLECIVDGLEGTYQFIKPLPARQSDLLLIHGQGQLDHVRSQGELLYEIASLSAGGAIKAAELAATGEPAFALIRPPGHHASRDFCWGYCWFNNVAIAVEKLRRARSVGKVLIVDIDLHLGDGTRNIFAQVPEVVYYHLDSMEGLEQTLDNNRDCDLVALSAGFDRHIEDWGKMLETDDFARIGRMIAGYACEYCGGRYFAVLEGGYNQRVLGDNVKAMLHGLDRRNYKPA